MQVDEVLRLLIRQVSLPWSAVMTIDVFGIEVQTCSNATIIIRESSGFCSSLSKARSPAIMVRELAADEVKLV